MTLLPHNLPTARTDPYDARGLDHKLGQYYTQEEVAALYYDLFKEHFDPTKFRMVEPAAGTGSFFKLLPPGSLGYDVDPKYPGVQTADFLTVRLPSDRPVAIIGNPPFGKNASMAVRFFNYAASQCAVIAMIFPRSFCKISVQNRLDSDFHLMREDVVPANAFLFRGRPYDVPAIFQIWEARNDQRPLQPVEYTHPAFEFTTAELADFAVRRVGARAGQIHHDFARSKSSNYFIRGAVEDMMSRLDFGKVVRNVAGNPSLAKSEIIALVREYETIA